MCRPSSELEEQGFSLALHCLVHCSFQLMTPILVKKKKKPPFCLHAERVNLPKALLGRMYWWRHAHHGTIVMGFGLFEMTLATLLNPTSLTIVPVF